MLLKHGKYHPIYWVRGNTTWRISELFHDSTTILVFWRSGYPFVCDPRNKRRRSNSSSRVKWSERPVKRVEARGTYNEHRRARLAVNFERRINLATVSRARAVRAGVFPQINRAEQKKYTPNDLGDGSRLFDFAIPSEHHFRLANSELFSVYPADCSWVLNNFAASEERGLRVRLRRQYRACRNAIHIFRSRRSLILRDTLRTSFPRTHGPVFHGLEETARKAFGHCTQWKYQCFRVIGTHGEFRRY